MMQEKCSHAVSQLKFSDYENVRVGGEPFVRVYRNDVCSSCGFYESVAMYEIHRDLEFLLDIVTGKGGKS